jgi:rhodanese-related sulfurtransferase
MEDAILDVREQDEFSRQRIKGSIWAPLSSFKHCAPGVLQRLAGKKVLIMCRSGGRAELALEQIRRMGFAGQLDAEVYPGGILEWVRQGKPVSEGAPLALPVMRQVQIVAGGVVLAASLAALFLMPLAAWVAAIVGAGLVFAGVTGFCGLAVLLSAMPWNRPDSETPCSGGCNCG